MFLYKSSIGYLYLFNLPKSVSCTTYKFINFGLWFAGGSLNSLRFLVITTLLWIRDAVSLLLTVIFFVMLQAVHNFFKEKLRFLVTDTIDGPQDSSKCIRVWPKSAGNQKGRSCRKRKDRFDKPFDKRGSHDWGDHPGKFLRYCIIFLVLA